MKPTQPQRRAGPLLLLVAAVMGIAVWTLVPRQKDSEPTYEGKRLSQWLAMISISYRPDRTSSEFLQASNAVVQIGTNGLPYLVEWIQYEPPRFYQGFYTVANAALERLPFRFLPDALADGLPPPRKYQRALAAVEALRILGPRQTPVLAALESWAASASSSQIRWRAIHALEAAGPEAHGQILRLFLSSTGHAHRQVMSVLGSLGTNATPTIPRLIADLNGNEAYLAAHILGQLHLEPQLCVPALQTALRAPDSFSRSAAAWALGQFGAAAAPALPALQAAITNSNPLVHDRATNSVRQITEALAQTTSGGR